MFTPLTPAEIKVYIEKMTEAAKKAAGEHGLAAPDMTAYMLGWVLGELKMVLAGRLSGRK